MILLRIALAIAALGSATAFGHQDEPQDLAGRLEEIRARGGTPALGAALVTREGLAGTWVAGKRSAEGDAAVAEGDLWHLGSCTKSMTATLIALLVARGDLSWDAPLAELVPELADEAGDEMDPAFRDVTLVELLCHRAGLKRDMDVALLMQLRLSNEPLVAQREKVMRTALMAPPAHAPRTQFLYSNDGFVIAGHLAERATEKPWEELIRELLFVPLGMTSAGFGAPGAASGTSAALDQPRGHANGKALEPGPFADNPAGLGPAGTVHASLADWAKYAQLHLRGAREDVTVGELTLTRDDFALLHEAYAGPGQGYAFGWVCETRPWSGGEGATLWHNGSNTMWYCETWLGLENGVAALATTNAATPAAQKAVGEAATLMIAEWQRRTAAAPR
jgi:CubicO group peptidase (beta-lactamase class C family)